MAASSLNIDKQHREAYRAQVRVAMSLREAAKDAGVGRILMELVHVRVSQLNGCGPCLDIHVADALAAGETPQRLAVLPAWRDVDLFDTTEKAALAVAEAVTTLPRAGQRSLELDAARDVLGDEVFSLVSWLAINMNVFNRISIVSGHPVRPRP